MLFYLEIIILRSKSRHRVIRNRISFNECASVVQLDDVRQGMVSTLQLAGNKNICGINFGE